MQTEFRTLCLKYVQAPSNMMAGTVSVAAPGAGTALTNDSFNDVGGSFDKVQGAILNLFKQGPVSDEVYFATYCLSFLYCTT